jgi:DNA-binding transcriptional MocR family regulator
MKEELFNFVSIQLDRNGKTPLYVQLYDALREAILCGQLTEGYLLPPVRRLASETGINAGTVVSAYRLLEKNGYIRAKRGSGFFVTDILVQSDEREDTREESTFLPHMTPVTGGIDLLSASPSPDYIRVTDFKRVINEVLDRDGGYAFGYQDGQGYYPLRQAMAGYLTKCGIRATADDVHTISGAQQGIDIVAKAVLSFGDYVLVERPTYAGAIGAFRSRGAKIIDAPMTEDGIDMDAVEDALRRFRPKLIYVMPNIQNPTGYSYSNAKKNRLLGLARRYQTLILEDDYISELDYSEDKLSPLKALDRDERVIYCKSFSKMFMPGLRLGFLVVPNRKRAHILAAKQQSDGSTAGLTQRAFDLYLRNGIWAKHSRSIYDVYRARHREMRALLEEHLPHTVTVYPARGGLTYWLKLPSGTLAKRTAETLAERGVLVQEGSAFFVNMGLDRFLRVSFAAEEGDRLREGIRILGQIITKEMK